jgi:glycosyltransferase involved in cell wall biosynthesis
MKVLMILNHAPDYREPFLRELGEYTNIDLTVIAQPCESDGLTPPDRRVGYEYIEIDAIRFFGFLWQPGLGRILRSKRWDVVCVSANLRHLSRIALFITNPKYWNKWLWWGHIFGKNKLHVLDVFRRFIINSAAGCLVHGKSIATELNDTYVTKAISFNNTEIRKNDFRPGRFNQHPELRLLFVGRYQQRKKLERLVDLAERRDDVQVRLIGPGMEKLSVSAELLNQRRAELFGRTVGEDLHCHFDWADLVANPGHVGLLAMNAAKHGKGIVIDSCSDHAPEFYLAKEADQPFISFNDQDEVDQFIDRVQNNPSLLEKWGKNLQEKAKEEYTIEHMAEVHVKAFEAVTSGKKI